MTDVTAALQRPNVLVLVDYYLPGYKSGGPIRSVSGLVDSLQSHFEFYVLTRDRDEGDIRPYPDVARDRWVKLGNASVFYASRMKLSLRGLFCIIGRLNPDIVYLNSFFSILSIKVLLLRRAGYIPNIPVIIAPRGEFSPGAIKIKSLKKSLYIRLSNAIGLYNDLIWQASTDMERQDIVRILAEKIGVYANEIFVAPDIPSIKVVKDEFKKFLKEKDCVSFIFISRITQKKNLLGAIQYLAHVRGNIALDIYGPIEDRSYWEKCQNTIKNLPNNITVNYISPLPYGQVANMFRKYHFFLFPTMGENFGHVIFEALANGCPVLISDQTPWQGLSSNGAGWNIPLDQPDQWRNAIQECVNMDSNTYNTMCVRARELAVSWVNSSDLLRQNMALFDHAWSARNTMFGM